MLVFLFSKLFEQYSQTNLPVIKTTPFKVTEYKKVWQIFRPKWEKIKIFVIILSLLLKNTKIHITKTHKIPINESVFYFQVQKVYLAGAFNKLNKHKNKHYIDCFLLKTLY